MDAEKKIKREKKGEKGQSSFLVCINVLDVWFIQSHGLVTAMFKYPINVWFGIIGRINHICYGVSHILSLFFRCVYHDICYWRVSNVLAFIACLCAHDDINVQSNVNSTSRPRD